MKCKSLAAASMKAVTLTSCEPQHLVVTQVQRVVNALRTMDSRSASCMCSGILLALASQSGNFEHGEEAHRTTCRFNAWASYGRYTLSVLAPERSVNQRKLNFVTQGASSGS